MSQDIYLSSLPPFSGRLYKEDGHWVANIKLYKPDYDRDDPRTWPVVSFSQRKNNLSELNVRRVAHDRALAIKIASQIPRHKLTEVRIDRHGQPVMMNRRFYRLPFTYDAEGFRKDIDSLDAEELDDWVYCVTGSYPKTLNTITDVGYSRPRASQEAYEQTLSLLDSFARKDTVLSPSQADLFKANSRILTLQKDIDARQATIDRFATARDAYAQDRARLDASEASNRSLLDENAELVSKLHGMEMRLDGERKARRIADERVLKLCEAARMCGGSGGGKRKRGAGDGRVGEGKRVRGEGDAPQCAHM